MGVPDPTILRRRGPNPGRGVLAAVLSMVVAARGLVEGAA